ncbi:MAG: hypothetical protein RL757_2610 [Bacteroidota bacterium]|jgi:hypothetical protein
MDLREQFLVVYSKKNSDLIVKNVGNDAEKVAILIDLLLHDEYRVSQRVSQVLIHIAEKYPAAIAPHLPALLDNLTQNSPVEAVRRNTIRIFWKFPTYPEPLLGQLVQICFQYLENPLEPIAVRAFSAYVLARICKSNEEFRPLAEELCDLLLLILPDGSAGEKATAHKILKQFGRG